MPMFTNYLKKESKVLSAGIELLQAYSQELESGSNIALEDLRMAAYAMQSLSEDGLFKKEETLLYPAIASSEQWSKLPLTKQEALQRSRLEADLIRISMMKLRGSIEAYEQTPEQRQRLSLHLNEVIHALECHLRYDGDCLLTIADQVLSKATQRHLFQRVQRMSHGYTTDGPRLILSRLRKVRGLSAA